MAKPLLEQHLQDFHQEVRREIPGFRVAYKEDSRLMQFFGLLLAPFHPGFLTAASTTWGSQVFFPSQHYVRVQDRRLTFSILAHELVHLMDSKEHGLWFSLSYVLPQALAVVPLAVFGVLGGWPALLVLAVGYLFSAVLYRYIAERKPYLFWVTFVPLVVVSLVWGGLLVKWWVLLVGLAVFLLVLPSPWRTTWELRGHAMALAVMWWLKRKDPPEEMYASFQKNFVDSSYLFMSRNPVKVMKALREATAHAKTGAILSEKPYAFVYDFLKERDLVV